MRGLNRWRGLLRHVGLLGFVLLFAGLPLQQVLHERAHHAASCKAAAPADCGQHPSSCSFGPSLSQCASALPSAPALGITVRAAPAAFPHPSSRLVWLAPHRVQSRGPPRLLS